MKQVTEIDSEFLCRLESSLEELKRGMVNLNALKEPDYLTTKEFLSRIKASRWKFEALVSNGLLEYKKVGRKYYIPINQVTKYFAGEMELE